MAEATAEVIIPEVNSDRGIIHAGRVMDPPELDSKVLAFIVGRLDIVRKTAFN